MIFRKLFPPVQSLLGVGVAIGMGACGVSGPDERIREALNAISDQILRENEGLRAESDSAVMSRNLDGERCITEVRHHSRDTLDEMSIFDVNPHSMWVGNLVRSRDAVNGVLSPVRAKRAPLTVGILGRARSADGKALSDPAFRMEEPSASAYERARMSLVGDGFEPIGGLTCETNEAYSAEQAAFNLKVDVSKLTNSLKSELRTSTRRNTRLVTINCTQLYYTLVMDEPDSRMRFFSEKQDVDELRQSIQAGDSISYVSSITYGKRIIIVAQTSESVAETGAGVSANIQLGAVGGGLSANHESKEVLRGSKYKVFAAGASPDDIRMILGTPNGSATPDITPIFGQDSRDRMVTYGAPLAYTLNFLNSAKAMKLALVGDYTVPVHSDSRSPLIRNATLRIVVQDDGFDFDSKMKIYSPTGDTVVQKTGTYEQEWKIGTIRDFPLGNRYADNLSGLWRVELQGVGNDLSRFNMILLSEDGSVLVERGMEIESNGSRLVADSVALMFRFERKFEKSCDMDGEEKARAAEFKERVDGSKQ